VQAKEEITHSILQQAGIVEEEKFITHHGHEIPCAKIPVPDTTAVSPENLQEVIGKAPYPTEKIYVSAPPPGVVMGLAWTSVGGTCLYVEAVSVPTVVVGESDKPASGGRVVEITGQLGSVMTESSKIAQTVAKNTLHAFDKNNAFFTKENIHIHCPEGATPKDGPSAGVTMASALLSLATGKPIPEDIAMTGELSITGLVLPVGGIKEKTIAARRAGIKRLCLPEANRRDVMELPEYLREDIEIHYFSKFSDLAHFTLEL